MYINTFKYTPADVDCKLCTEYVKKFGCTACGCPWMAERIEAGVVGYAEVVRQMFPHDKRLMARLEPLIRDFPGMLWKDERHRQRMEGVKIHLGHSKRRDTPAFFAVMFLFTSDEDIYNASFQASHACMEAIEQAISRHYSNNRLDAEAAVNDVLEQFGPDRVQYVLANTVRHKEWDGRISRDNKAWASTMPLPEGSPQDRHSEYLVVDRCNPGLTDLFLKQVRQLAGEREKPSVREKLQKAPAAPRRSAPAKKKEVER